MKKKNTELANDNGRFNSIPQRILGRFNFRYQRACSRFFPIDFMCRRARWIPSIAGLFFCTRDFHFRSLPFAPVHYTVLRVALEQKLINFPRLVVLYGWGWWKCARNNVQPPAWFSGFSNKPPNRIIVTTNW